MNNPRIAVANGGFLGAFDSSEPGEVYVYGTTEEGEDFSLDLTPEEALAFASRLAEAADEAVERAPEITD